MRDGRDDRSAREDAAQVDGCQVRASCLDLTGTATGDDAGADAAAARVGMPGADDIADLADVFGLLGEPSRVRILIALLSGPRRVHDLAEAIGLSESATSHALRLLRAHRVVDVRREGRVAYYSLADDHVRKLLELGLAHVGHTVLIHAIGEASANGSDKETDH